MISILDVAQFFIAKPDPDMTPTKVQVLAYYAQGYSLGIFGKPLFSDCVKAWYFGVLIDSLHSRFMEFDDLRIPPDPPIGNPIEDCDTIRLLEAVWRAYGSFSTDMLMAMTYADPPWKEVFPKGRDAKILHESMRVYFESRANDLNLDGKDISVEEIFGSGVTLTE